MEQLTVKKLLELCKQAVKSGYGERKIVISDDNEGNGFHGLFYGLTVVKEEDKDYYPIYDSREEDINNLIVLG